MTKDVKTMERPVAVSGLGSGVVDSNRFYSMLLDARAATNVTTESMHDVADKLLKGEKDNSKIALDQLWTLKKTLIDPDTDDTVECLISYYQDKIDILREREEAIKKASKETRALIEEKMKMDEELAQVKSKISNCASDLQELHAKLEKLKKRESELTFAEQRLRKEISANENKIVGGLHDIIMHRTEYSESKDGTESIDIGGQENEDASNRYNDAFMNREQAAAPNVINVNDNSEEFPVNTASARITTTMPAYEPVVYPKSVVRMSGKIIGEYYHDGNVVSKEERHYIYNSRFLAENLSSCLNALRVKFSQDIHAEIIKVVEDAANRVRENSRFHFEVSTNEILNDKLLRGLSQDLRRRAWDDAGHFANKLNAKIEALGANYEAMLQEQMERCTGM